MARNVKLTNFGKQNHLEGLFEQSLNHKPEKSALQISGQAQKFAFLTHAQVLLGPLVCGSQSESQWLTRDQPATEATLQLRTALVLVMQC